MLLLYVMMAAAACPLVIQLTPRWQSELRLCCCMAGLAGLAHKMQKDELTNILDRPMLYGRQSVWLQHACSLMGCPTQGPPAEPAPLLPAEGVQASALSPCFVM